MPRLLLLTQYFPPEMGAPQTRLSELGVRLVELGWQVEALTAVPSYPAGRVFDGYPRARPIEEDRGGIRTVRVPILPTQRGFLRRLLSYFSFVVSAGLWGPARCRRPDVLYVESPPLFIGYAARYLGRRFRCPYVFNVSDLWPESAVRVGMLRAGGILARLAERLELGFYRRAAAVTGQSQEIIDSIRARSAGVDARVITNGVEPERFGPGHADPEARRLLGDEPGPIFVHAGLLGLAQALDQMLDIAAELPDDLPGRIVLIGDGPMRDHLARRIEAEGLRRVRLLPAQPRERIPALLAAADAAIIGLRTHLPGGVPSKMYEAMASALPILLIAAGEAAARVEEGPAGLVVEPGDLTAARGAFERLAVDPELRARLGRSGRRLAEERYSRAALAGQLDELLRPLAAAAAEPAPHGAGA